ncbi:glycerol-3-phosphate dehydrogenase, partial [Vibrio sp. 10N.222.48.A3]
MTETIRPTISTNAYGKEIAMTVIGAGSYGTSLAISLA